MLIDETAGSSGELLPYMFRKFDLGPLIGKAIWDGLVGLLGYPVLLDGGYVTAPNVAIWDGDGWVVENVGVPPAIEVEQLQAEVIAGRQTHLAGEARVARRCPSKLTSSECPQKSLVPRGATNAPGSSG